MSANLSRKSLILKDLRATDTYISGEEISKNLKISRTAVWKHIQELKKDGYDIVSYTKKGYKLHSIPDKISKEEIVPYLDTETFGKDYHYYDTIDSTNIAAKFLAEKGAVEGSVICAEEQTSGKGRLGRNWISPSGQGVYFSVIIRPKIPVYQAPQITLVVSCVLAKVLNEKYNIPAKIKWPNDIVVNNNKIAGILVEMSSDMDRINHAVIGIGINVNNPESAFTSDDFNFKPTSVLLELGTSVTRSDLMLTLLKELEIAYHTFIDAGFTSFKESWESYAYSINKTVNVTTTTKTYSGILTGIDATGALLLEIDGEVQTIYSGEIIL